MPQHATAGRPGDTAERCAVLPFSGGPNGKFGMNGEKHTVGRLADYSGRRNIATVYEADILVM